MANKYKLTGCARFLIFLVIVVPIVIVGVLYMKGGDPTKLFRDATDKIEEITTSTKSTKPLSEENLKEKAIETQRNRIKTLEKELDQVKRALDDCRSR